MIIVTLRCMATLALSTILSGCVSGAPRGEHSSQSSDVQAGSTLVLHAAPGAPGELAQGVTQSTHEFTLQPADGLFVYESAPIHHARGFDEALVSFNADVPAGTSMSVDVRVGTVAHGLVSPWMTIAWWGAGSVGEPVRAFSDEATGLAGKIDIDYFVSKQTFDLMQYRVRTTSADVRVQRIGISFGEPKSSVHRWSWRETTRRSEPRRLPVPFFSQRTPRGELSGRLCSPTSVTMLLNYRGINSSVYDVAQTCHDPEHDLFGNWPRNVQGAYVLGLPGYLTRIDTWAQVERYFASGQPIIASVQVAEGELRGAPYKKTGGHLIVLHGFTEDGNVIVSDPAAGTPETGQLVYTRADLTNVWMYRTDGTGYILMQP